MLIKNDMKDFIRVSCVVKVVVALFILTTFGCATKPVEIYTPLSFESAVRIAASKVLSDGQLRMGPLAYVKKPLFVVDNIIDSDTGEVTMTSRKISELIIAEAKDNFPQLQVQSLKIGNVHQATYVIVGVISQEFNNVAKAKIPHLFLSLVDYSSSKVVSAVDVWIADRGLDFEPTPVFKDSPMYLKDARVEAMIATAKAQAGDFADKVYFDSLETSALVDEAGTLYDQGQYSQSLALFAKAAERDDGKTLKTFSGLYQNFFKLSRLEEAKVAFNQLIKLGVANNNLSIKFLFAVDSTEFSGSGDDMIEYSIWLDEISKVLAESNRCVEVIGHASKSGGFDYNKKLSLKRAQAVQMKLKSRASEITMNTKALGKGFTENIIGIGSNDYRDAIDRRVEFKIVNCINF